MCKNIECIKMYRKFCNKNNNKSSMLESKLLNKKHQRELSQINLYREWV